MPDDPLGYLITWTCRGTWLPGDGRGWVDRENNLYGRPRLPPNPHLEAAMRANMRDDPLILDRAARDGVDAAIREHCQHKGWRLYAVNVRSNHIHVVVWAPLPPERIMQSLKSWATRRLRAERVIGPRRQPWTAHGSTEYLWKDENLASAIDYVVRRQDLKGPA